MPVSLFYYDSFNLLVLMVLGGRGPWSVFVDHAEKLLRTDERCGYSFNLLINY